MKLFLISLVLILNIACARKAPSDEQGSFGLVECYSNTNELTYSDYPTTFVQIKEQIFEIDGETYLGTCYEVD